MFKRIVISILTFVFAATLLCGCSFFSHDTERDYQQVVATVQSYEIENSKLEEPYKTTAHDVYKYDIVEYVRNNESNLTNSFGSDIKGMYDYAVDILVNLKIVVNEVDALIAAGDIEWGFTETNAVKKRVYTLIDNTLMSLKNDILAERDEQQITTEGDGELNTSTTFPVKEEEESDDEVRDTEEWQPDISRYPGLTGDASKRSLENEAMRRFITLLKDRVADDFRVTAEERKAFDEDIEEINKIIDEQGISQVYPMIGSTALMYYVSGKSIEQSEKITCMQEYLVDGAIVSDEEVSEAFTAKLNEQRTSFANIAAFDEAMKGEDPVLYYPNNNYFYVKHILLPFSDEQKTELENYKKRLNVTKAEIEAFRSNLAQSIVCYPHVSGENDLSRPMTVDKVLENIKSVMRPLESNVALADVAFDDLIFEYNTDPGAFNNNKGYVVKYKLDDGEDETYMQEFADAARYMYDNLGEGQVYYEKVITDYGVHIMYFASKTKVGAVSINDYTTPGRVETYYDLIEEPIKTKRESVFYQNWENKILSYNYKKYVTIYSDRYTNLWKS